MIQTPTGTPQWLRRAFAIFNEELLRREPELLGYRHDGTTLHLRFRVPLAVPWCQVHVQSTLAGEGGMTYDAVNYTSSTKVDCRASRVQDVAVTDVPHERFCVWLIPIQTDGAGVDVLYNGVAGEDNMSFATVGL